MPEISEPVDLLGDPLRALPDKRGRRKLRFHQEVYENVEVLAAGGLSHDDIADAVGISAPTLRKYFRPELGKAAARQRARVLAVLAKQADKGNVSAARAYLSEIDRHQAAAHFQRRERNAPAAAPAPSRIGKKAAARADADAEVAIDDKFAPRGAPRLAVINGQAVDSDS